MERLGVEATARASLGLYNTTEEVDSLVTALGARAGGVRLMSDLRELYQEIILDHNRRPQELRRAGAGQPRGDRATTRSAATGSPSRCA